MSQIDRAVSEMTGTGAPPRRNGELVFEAPWQGRAFGMALAVTQRLGLPWMEFQTRLIAEIAAHPDSPYYDCWLAALEQLLVDYKVMTRSELEHVLRAHE